MRRRLDLQAGEGTSAQPDPPVRRPHVRARVPAPHPGSGPIQTTPQKHHGVLRGIRRRMGGWTQLDIDGYITQMQTERDHDEMPRVHNEWSSEDDITPDEDSGDEYLPPGATVGGDLDFSGFSAFEEEEEAELYEPDPDSDSDGESEGDGPVQQRGEGGRERGGARSRGRGAPPSDEGWSEDPTPPVMHPFTVPLDLLCQCQQHP